MKHGMTILSGEERRRAAGWHVSLSARKATFTGLPSMCAQVFLLPLNPEESPGGSKDGGDLGPGRAC